jgi:hypothetical protein
MKSFQREQSDVAVTGDTPVAQCPLCGEAISLDMPDWRAPAKWRDALRYRELWSVVSVEFRASRSVDGAALKLSIPADRVRFLLEFLCTELCGCRLTTCVSCLDDYRSEL